MKRIRLRVEIEMEQYGDGEINEETLEGALTVGFWEWCGISVNNVKITKFEIEEEVEDEG